MEKDAVFQCSRTQAGESWDSWFDSEGVSDDFMVEREQPPEQERESF